MKNEAHECSDTASWKITRRMYSALKLSRTGLSLIDCDAAKKKNEITKNVGRSPNSF